MSKHLHQFKLPVGQRLIDYHSRFDGSLLKRWSVGLGCLHQVASHHKLIDRRLRLRPLRVELAYAGSRCTLMTLQDSTHSGIRHMVASPRGWLSLFLFTQLITVGHPGADGGVTWLSGDSLLAACCFSCRLKCRHVAQRIRPRSRGKHQPTRSALPFLPTRGRRGGMGQNRPERSAGSFWTIADAPAPGTKHRSPAHPHPAPVDGGVMLGDAHCFKSFSSALLINKYSLPTRFLSSIPAASSLDRYRDAVFRSTPKLPTTYSIFE